MPNKKQDTTIILILGGMNMIGPFTTDMYLPAFSAIANGLHTTVHVVGYSLSSYFAGICLGQLMHGPLVDRFGRKKPLLIFLGLYIISTLACSQAASVEGLIVYRFFQALAASCGMVVSRAVVRDLFPADKIAKVFSMLILVMGVAPIIAPTVGGYVVAGWGWKAVFWTLAAIGAVVLLLVFLILPESRGADKTVSLRPAAIFSRYRLVFSHPQFKPFAFATAMNTGGLFAYIAGSSFVYMQLLGVSEKQFGWVFGFNAVCFITGSQINRLLLRFSKSYLIAARMVIFQLAVSLFLILLVANGWMTVATLMATTGMYAVCLGVIGPNTMALTLHPFVNNAGVASSSLGSLQMGAGAVSAGLVSYFSSGTALPMAAVMAVATGLGLVSLHVGLKTYREKP
ncbi:MAG: multidrug effflux MFS transporter [Saprospiraceae bacterium]|nr:multidrug effflux MFS transporter [Saprospiraceae bacterium]